jgi:hypothetical protein
LSYKYGIAELKDKNKYFPALYWSRGQIVWLSGNPAKTTPGIEQCFGKFVCVVVWHVMTRLSREPGTLLGLQQLMKGRNQIRD